MDLQPRQMWTLFDSARSWQNTQALKVSFLPISGTGTVNSFALPSVITCLQREHTQCIVSAPSKNFWGCPDLLLYLLCKGRSFWHRDIEAPCSPDKLGQRWRSLLQFILSVVEPISVIPLCLSTIDFRAVPRSSALCPLDMP